jgi:hypothetical protein
VEHSQAELHRQCPIGADEFTDGHVSPPSSDLIALGGAESVSEKQKGRGSRFGFRGLEAADAVGSQQVGGLQALVPGK